MAVHVFPSENDVGPATNDGKSFTEEKWRRRFHNGNNNLNHIITGGTVNSTGTSPPTVTFNAMDAIISGYLLREDSTFTATLTASTTNYVFRQLTFSGGIATGAQFSIATTLGAPPADSIYLGAFTTSGTAVTTQQQFLKTTPNSVTGSYTGSGTGGVDVPIGFRPSFVIVGSASEAWLRTDGIAVGYGVTGDTTVAADLVIEDYGFSGDASINSAEAFGFTALA